MTRYIVNRLLLLIPTLLGIYTLAFILMRVLPGDPATFLIGFRDDDAALANLRRVMHLDEPVINQYVAFLGDAVRGDLGQSYLTRQPVSEMIWNAFPPTAALAASSMILATVIGVPLGIFAALRRESVWDNLSRFLALIGVSIPVFWLGVQLQILFSLQLKWLPPSGAGYDTHLILPTIALCGGTLALLTRMTRSTMIEQLSQDYVRTARSKGIRSRAVVWRHTFRNALLPIVTVAGSNMASLLSGALLVEVIFNWPGIGRLLFQAISTRDYTLLQGLVIVFALIYAGINLIIDLSYALIDPRIRYE